MSLVDRMSNELGLDKYYLKNNIRRNDKYRKYTILKKNGKPREILHPAKEIKVMQYWVCRNIFNHFPVSYYSKAYSKGDSIKKNALMHRHSNYILHTDIVDFFGNITRDKVLKLLADNSELVTKLRIEEEDIEDILNIILYKGKRLVVGSVASPLISNCIMYNFDNKIYETLIKGKNMIYTRYADDIIISSNTFIESSILNTIDDLLNDEGFTRNSEKTYFMNKSTRRMVTGVVLDNNTDKLSLGSDNYRKIKREIYNFLVKNTGDINKIRGYLSYITSIDREKYNSIKETYKKYDKRSVLFK